MPLAALQEEDDEEETQEMTEVLAAAEEISMEKLTSVPGGVFRKRENSTQCFFCV